MPNYALGTIRQVALGAQAPRATWRFKLLKTRKHTHCFEKFRMEVAHDVIEINKAAIMAARKTVDPFHFDLAGQRDFMP